MHYEHVMVAVQQKCHYAYLNLLIKPTGRPTRLVKAACLIKPIHAYLSQQA